MQEYIGIAGFLCLSLSFRATIPGATIYQSRRGGPITDRQVPRPAAHYGRRAKSPDLGR